MVASSSHPCALVLPTTLTCPPQELDFKCEALNAERCRANLQASSRRGAWYAGRWAGRGLKPSSV